MKNPAASSGVVVVPAAVGEARQGCAGLSRSRGLRERAGRAEARGGGVTKISYSVRIVASYSHTVTSTASSSSSRVRAANWSERAPRPSAAEATTEGRREGAEHGGAQLERRGAKPLTLALTPSAPPARRTAAVFPGLGWAGRLRTAWLSRK